MSKSINPATTRKYDGTVARVAGNLLSGAAEDWLPESRRASVVKAAVATARAIVAETKRTELIPEENI